MSGTPDNAAALPFDMRHAPLTFADLVFVNPLVQQALADYAQRQKHRCLILHGPYGCAKSTTAEVIIRDRQKLIGADLLPIARFVGAELNGHMTKIDNAFNYALTLGGETEPYVIIDEGDQMRAADQYTMRHNISTVAYYRVIITTNDLGKIDGGLRSRCEMLPLLAPQANDWLPVAQRILAIEGVQVGLPRLTAMLRQVQDFRDLLRMLEDFVMRCRTTNNASTYTPPKLSVLPSIIQLPTTPDKPTP